MLGYSLATCAGICAAMASICAKLAMASTATLDLCRIMYHAAVEGAQSSGITVMQEIIPILPECEAVVTYIRLAFFVLIFLCNALMWTLFTKSLQKCPNTVEATVINTASNLLFTALAGHLLFQEALSLMWLGGASLILIGLIFIHSSSSEEVHVNSQSQKPKVS